ncbi:hypothetical protein [Holdemania massiliensis]|uniref:hypothetical protein n=1 Tax=Holdemania massiliensis TaxID=1468449 RepID=UPI0035621B10
MGKVHQIYHTVEGFSFLKSKVEELTMKIKESVLAVYEATGVYTKPLQRFLEKNENKQSRSRRCNQRNSGKQKHITRKQIKKILNP